MGAGSFTRSLFEKSGKFAVQVPFVSQAQFVAKMGTTSMRGGAGKLEGVEMFYERDVPMVRGCAALCARIGSGCERELVKPLSARQRVG